MSDNRSNALYEIDTIVQTAGLTGDFSSKDGEGREVKTRAWKGA